MGRVRRAGLLAAAAAVPAGLAYRFALAYRVRAGYPRRHPPRVTPDMLGLPFEETTVRSAGLDLPAWFIPARDGAPGPGLVLVHGWESARDRTLPMAVFLHAAGYHCLTFDVRGHGNNPPEDLPISAGEFGLDTTAALATLLARPDVTAGGVVGHSLGGIGAILAAAADPRAAVLVASSTPADPYRLTRQTFRLAHLPIPDPIAYPLAWLTTRVYLRPRGHVVRDVSASDAIARYRGPVLLAHGDLDTVVPLAHMGRLAVAARAGRASPTSDDSSESAPVETMLVPNGQHSWLYEFPEYRRTVTSFVARAFAGPMEPTAAGELAAATPAERIPDAEGRFGAIEDQPGGFRTLAQVALPGATRPLPGATASMALEDEPMVEP